ncbi:hypothetical protein J7M02_04455 [Candidatus Aerophobetes bacterium]|nr:hypothetical protein [Candidatus Aerophobetes bacterium]
MTKEFLDYLEDIIEAMDDAVKFTQNMEYQPVFPWLKICQGKDFINKLIFDKYVKINKNYH